MRIIDRILGRVAPDADAQRREREQQLTDLREVLATPQGRRVLWRLLGFTELYHCALEQDERADHARRGQRKVGVWLLQEICAADPEMWLQMQREASSMNAQRA